MASGDGGAAASAACAVSERAAGVPFDAGGPVLAVRASGGRFAAGTDLLLSTAPGRAPESGAIGANVTELPLSA
jgi:hypothetical protein